MTVGAVIMLFVWIVIICAAAWFATWVIAQFQPPDPVGRVARVVIIGLALVLIVLVLLSAVGGGINMNTTIGG